MKNFLFSTIGGVLALFVFVLGSLFGEFIKVVQPSQSSIKELEINEQINFSILATPDIYVVSPSFYANNLNDDDKSVINAKFTEILALVKQNELCSGGSYQTYLEPRIEVQNSTRLSFRSFLSCKFKESELEKYNTLIANIENIIVNSPIKMHLSRIEPEFSAETNEKNKAQLKQGLIKAALNNANTLSSEFERTCELREIGFHGLGAILRADLTMEAGGMSGASKMSAPKMQEQSISAGASARYICK